MATLEERGKGQAVFKTALVREGQPTQAQPTSPPPNNHPATEPWSRMKCLEEIVLLLKRFKDTVLAFLMRKETKNKNNTEFEQLIP